MTFLSGLSFWSGILWELGSVASGDRFYWGRPRKFCLRVFYAMAFDLNRLLERTFYAESWVRSSQDFSRSCYRPRSIFRDEPPEPTPGIHSPIAPTCIYLVAYFNKTYKHNSRKHFSSRVYFHDVYSPYYYYYIIQKLQVLRLITLST